MIKTNLKNIEIFFFLEPGIFFSTSNMKLNEFTAIEDSYLCPSKVRC